MIPNGYLIFEDESFLDSTVAKMNALRKNGQFCDVRLQVTHPFLTLLFSVILRRLKHDSGKSVFHYMWVLDLWMAFRRVTFINRQNQTLCVQNISKTEWEV